MQTFTLNQLQSKTVTELKSIAKSYNLKGYSTLRKSDLINFIDSNRPNHHTTNLTYIFNDNLNLYSITGSNHFNLTQKEMVSIIIQHVQDKPFSNQVCDIEELKVFYKAGFRVHGQESLKLNEAIELFKSNGSTLNVRANTCQANLINLDKNEDAIESIVASQEVVPTVELSEQEKSLIGRKVFGQWGVMAGWNYGVITDVQKDEVGTDVIIEWVDEWEGEERESNTRREDLDDIVIADNDTELDSVGIYLLPIEASQESSSTQTTQEPNTNNLYWYAYTLRGFSLGCQPSNHITHNDSIGRHGIVAYDRPLTAQELSDYELVEYSTPSRKETHFTVHNRSFISYQEAYEHCLQCDYEPDLMIVESVTT